MKKLTITIFAVISFISVMGQSKPSKHKVTVGYNTDGGKYILGESLSDSPVTYSESEGLKVANIGYFKPVKWCFLSGSSTYIVMTGIKNGKPNMDNWDTMQFSMKKENFRWLNDSTAIYIKPIK